MVRIVLEGISGVTWDQNIWIQWGRFSRNRWKNFQNDRYHRFRKTDDVREIMPTQQLFKKSRLETILTLGLHIWFKTVFAISMRPNYIRIFYIKALFWDIKQKRLLQRMLTSFNQRLRIVWMKDCRFFYLILSWGKNG